MRCSNLRDLWLPGLLVLLCGCGVNTPDLVEVEGVLMLNGQPLPEFKVMFHPDPEELNFGLSSSGETDQNGKFTLLYQSTPPKSGAAVGWHKVTLEDLVPAKLRDDGGEPIPRRVDRKFLSTTSTPIKIELSDDAQQQVTIEATEFEKRDSSGRDG